MKKELLKVAMRQNALFLPDAKIINKEGVSLSETTSVLIANCTKLGFTFSEKLLKALNNESPKGKLILFDFLKEISGVNKNWTPLVKQWDNPTGESVVDHVKTFFANVFRSKKGVMLECGHIIPEGTFPLERYNGCPFCGTPFEFGKLEIGNSSGKLKVLELWIEEDMRTYLFSLLESPVALDATQEESLKALLSEYGLPKDVSIKMKETTVLVIDSLVEHQKVREASDLFSSPSDVLRFLWYKHTGFLQLIEPKTIIKRISMNARNQQTGMSTEVQSKIKSMADLKLKFSRSEGRMYASWLNELSMDIEKQCEVMHPKRSIWARVIRALRLAEYAKKPGFERLSLLLDTFYNEKYQVWASSYDSSRTMYDASKTFALLKERPGLFARSLFSNMLWYGPDTTLEHFKEVVSQVPLRLVVTLNMYAENYFDKDSSRIAKPLGGTNKRIPANKLLKFYTDEDLGRMQESIKTLTLEVLESKFKNEANEKNSVFIDESLFKIPLAIGDRSETVQDSSATLAGTKSPIEGSTVRLFMQWGEGLPAQHLDMDLSCSVSYDSKNEFCSYSQLVIPGCKHSGDIQRIPNKVGTAEYIDIDVYELKNKGAKYVTFTCNAYTNGSLEPNMVFGWMNSNKPMKISNSGVAYNPADVQHQVRISKSVSKGLVFGVLDVENKEIIWLEMSFGGQVVQNLDVKGVDTLLRKLKTKIKVGDVLKLRAQAQGQELVTISDDAEEVFTSSWASDSSLVASFLLD